MSIDMRKFQYISRAFDVFCFIYLVSIFYRNLKINGVEYGAYFRPISAIPALAVFGVALAIQYFRQKSKEDQPVSSESVKKDLVAGMANFATDLMEKPLKVFGRYAWSSVKATFKNFFFFTLLLIPLGVIFAIIQVILTGSANFQASF